MDSQLHPRLLCLLAAALLGLLLVPPTAGAGRPTRILQKTIEQPQRATAHRYNARDDRGTSLDTLKVVPVGNGDYLGVYHAQVQGVFVVELARSTDLITWSHVADLAVHGSQPTLARTSGGGFLLAYEKDSGCTGKGPGGNCLAFAHYASLGALLAGAANRTFQAPRTLSACAEGTPNIYSARLAPDIEHSTIQVGFHYFRNCDVDRQASGTLKNFAGWSARVDTRANRALEALHPGGNIGDRDDVRVRAGVFNIQEVQFRKGDFGSWRVYLLDRRTRQVRALRIKTARGSTSFANPTFTILRSPRGRPALLVALFVPVKGAGLNEGGELVYYRELRGRTARQLKPVRST